MQDKGCINKLEKAYDVPIYTQGGRTFFNKTEGFRSMSESFQPKTSCVSLNMLWKIGVSLFAIRHTPRQATLQNNAANLLTPPKVEFAS